MSKFFTRSLFSIVVLLMLATSSSALGAHVSRNDRIRAAHHRASPRSQRGLRRHRRSAVVRDAKVASAATATLLGNETLEPLKDSLAAGEAEAFPFPARASGTASAVHVYVDNNNGAKTLIVGLYSAVGAHPGALLTTGSLSSPRGGTWNVIPVTAVPVTSGASYWLAVLGAGGTFRYRDLASGPCIAETNVQHNLRALTASWSTGDLYSTCPISAYLTSTGPAFPLEPPTPVEITPPNKPPTEPPTPPTEPTPPPPAAPTSGALPAISGATIVGRRLTTTSGGWSGSPKSYSYKWQDCNTSGSGCMSIGGATSSSYTLAAGDVGHTMRVAVTATNAGGSTTATSAQSGIVAAAAPPSEPPAPAPAARFTFSPSSPVAGQQVALNGTASTCADSPCTYTWSDDASTIQPLPALWTLGSGPTLSFTFSDPGTKYLRLSITDAAGQVGTVEHNVVVTGEAPPAEEPPASEEPPVTEPPPSEPPVTEPPVTEPPVTEPPPSESPSTQTNCIKVPSACGYPDATNTGVPAGTTLTQQNGDITVTKPGTTISGVALNGTIDVDANNTTIEDSEITVDGTQAGCNSPCGGKGIWTKPGVTGTIIRHVTCHGGAPTGDNVTEFCIQSNDSSTQVSYAHLYNCTTGFVGPGTWSNSFVDQTGATIPQEHYEDIYYGGGGGPLIVNHNTMLNPQGQTAVVFASVDFGNQTTLTITNNLMAGGGYMIYGGGSGNGGKVLGPVTITGNRFSRKYYPDGGYYGVDSYMTNSVTTWSGNIWDETLQTVGE